MPVQIVGARSRHAVEGNDLSAPAFRNRVVAVSGTVFLLPIHEQHSRVRNVRRIDEERFSISRAAPVPRRPGVFEPQHDDPFPKAVGLSGGGLLLVGQHLVNLFASEQLEGSLLPACETLRLEGLCLRAGAGNRVRREQDQAATLHHVELGGVHGTPQEPLARQVRGAFRQAVVAIGEQHGAWPEPHHLRSRFPADFNHRTLRSVSVARGYRPHAQNRKKGGRQAKSRSVHSAFSLD